MSTSTLGSRGRTRPVLLVVGLVLLAVGVLGWALASAAGGGDPDEATAGVDGDGGDLAAPAEAESDAGADDRAAGDQGPSDTDADELAADADGAEPAQEPQEPAAPERGRLVFHHVGDVNLDHAYVPVFRQDGPAAAWDGVRAVFATADVVMVNLECTASDLGSPEPKQFTFRCDLDSLPAMRDAGVDVVTLANNHSGDFGMEAMVDSVPNVEAAGMVAVGVGVDEADAYRPRIVEAAGWRIAVLGFGGVVPVPEWHARGDRPGQATGYDAERMAQAVRDARTDADLVVVSVHWGAEGAFTPRPEDVVKARAVAEAGADVVFGHHAHRLQPVEVVDGMPVFWNLGNFVWPRHSEAGATTAIAEWVVEPDGSTSACLLPVMIDARGVPQPTGGDPDCATP